MKTLDEKLNRLRPARRRKIEARAAALIAEEMSLQDLRRAHQLTQAHLARVLGTGQDSISRLEQRSDLLISTLRQYVEGIGGRLALIAEFRDRAPVRLQGFSALAAAPPARQAPRRRATPRRRAQRLADLGGQFPLTPPPRRRRPRARR